MKKGGRNQRVDSFVESLTVVTVLILKDDFESDRLDEMPSTGNANYIDGDLMYLNDMEILEEIKGRVLLR